MAFACLLHSMLDWGQTNQSPQVWRKLSRKSCENIKRRIQRIHKDLFGTIWFIHFCRTVWYYHNKINAHFKTFKSHSKTKEITTYFFCLCLNDSIFVWSIILKNVYSKEKRNPLLLKCHPSHLKHQVSCNKHTLMSNMSLDTKHEFEKKKV